VFSRDFLVTECAPDADRRRIHDCGGHLPAVLRALLITRRRVVEDAGLRRSMDSAVAVAHALKATQDVVGTVL
jgi:hypothetical protein